jgi:hypothetical protein
MSSRPTQDPMQSRDGPDDRRTTRDASDRGLAETLHLTRSPRNSKRLAEALADVRAGKNLEQRVLTEE